MRNGTRCVCLPFSVSSESSVANPHILKRRRRL